MMAPKAVLPADLPINPPTMPPVPAPMAAPCRVLLRVWQAEPKISMPAMITVMRLRFFILKGLFTTKSQSRCQ